MIPVYHHRVWFFPVIGVKRGEGQWGCMFLKKVGISRRGIQKEREGTDTPSHTMFLSFDIIS